MIIPITNADDPRIADYTSVRERDLTGRDGKFIVEGKVTLDVFLNRARFEVESLFLEEGRLPVLDSLLSGLDDDISVYTAPQSVMDQIVGFPIHRGILACGRKSAQPEFTHWLKALGGPRTLVFAVGLSNHDNVCAIFRNAAALGAEAIILDETSCDPLYRKAIRVSAGTALWMPFYHGGEAGALLEAILASGASCWALTPGEGAADLYQKPSAARVCLVVGPEGPGLPEALIARAEPVVIPMSSGVDSLNVATALAIALSARLSANPPC